MEPLLNGSIGPVEVLEGPTGRRRWTDEKKAQIVAESFAPGARVNDVARRHGMQPQHLSTWRGLAKNGKIVLPHEVGQQSFASVVIDDAAGPSQATEPSTSSIVIEIETDGVTARVPADIGAKRLAEIVIALRAAR